MRLGTPVDYFSTRDKRSSHLLPRSQPPKNQSVSRDGRVVALLIIAFGILTFFVPLITVDPPVAGATHWSAFDIVLQMYKGSLPSPICERCGEPLVRSLIALPFEITLIYLLMAAALIPLSVPYASKAVATIAALGTAGGLYLSRFATRWAMEETFYGRWSRVQHVHYGALQLALILIMAALFLVSMKPVSITKDSG
jgi:hypothetical protein